MVYFLFFLFKTNINFLFILFILGIISIFSFIQLIRLHKRNPDIEWSTPKLFLLLILFSSLSYLFIY